MFIECPHIDKENMKLAGIAKAIPFFCFRGGKWRREWWKQPDACKENGEILGHRNGVYREKCRF